MYKEELCFTEHNRIKDKHDAQPQGIRTLGRVQVYAHKIAGSDKELYLLRDTSNLVVYHGRNWLAQRAFNINDVTDSGWKDCYVSWLGIGTGGTLEGNPMIISSPDLTNTALATHGVIDSGIRYVTVAGKQYHKFDDTYPTLTVDSEVSATGLGNAYDNKLVMKVVTTLAADEANDDGGVSDPDAYQMINEAGLFFADVNTISPVPTKMEMFARVAFPSIKKNSEVELIFTWYIFF